MSAFETLCGILSVVCLVGIGYIIGITGPYGRYLDNCGKMIGKMGDAMDSFTKVAEEILKQNS